MGYLQPKRRRKHVRPTRSFLRTPPHKIKTLQHRGFSGWFDDLLSTGKSLVSGIPQVSSALNTVKAKVGIFLGLPTRLDRSLQHIQEQRMKPGAKASKWNALEHGVRVLQQKYPSLESRLMTVIAKKDQGVSVSLLMEAVPVAAEVTGMLKATSKIESELKPTTLGFNMPSFAQGWMSWLPYVGLGVMGVWFFTRRK